MSLVSTTTAYPYNTHQRRLSRRSSLLPRSSEALVNLWSRMADAPFPPSAARRGTGATGSTRRGSRPRTSRRRGAPSPTPAAETSIRIASYEKNLYTLSLFYYMSCCSTPICLQESIDAIAQVSFCARSSHSLLLLQPRLPPSSHPNNLDSGMEHSQPIAGIDDRIHWSCATGVHRCSLTQYQYYTSLQHVTMLHSRPGLLASAYNTSCPTTTHTRQRFAFVCAVTTQCELRSRHVGCTCPLDHPMIRGCDLAKLVHMSVNTHYIGANKHVIAFH